MADGEPRKTGGEGIGVRPKHCRLSTYHYIYIFEPQLGRLYIKKYLSFPAKIVTGDDDYDFGQKAPCKYTCKYTSKKKKREEKKRKKDSAGSDDTASMIKGGGCIGARTRQPPAALTIKKKLMWVRGLCPSRKLKNYKTCRQNQCGPRVSMRCS